METIQICPIGSDLASRRSAAQLRHDSEELLDQNERVVFDLSKVESVSESYADELFGVLALSTGTEKFFGSVAIRGASRIVLEQIAKAIQVRLEGQEFQESIHALVAAKRSQQAYRSGDGRF